MKSVSCSSTVGSEYLIIVVDPIYYWMVQVMLIISIICLRSPDHAASAIEAGAGDLAVQAMKRFPLAAQMQRNACNMIRNIAVRNAENR